MKITKNKLKTNVDYDKQFTNHFQLDIVINNDRSYFTWNNRVANCSPYYPGYLYHLSKYGVYWITNFEIDYYCDDYLNINKFYYLCKIYVDKCFVLNHKTRAYPH